MKKKASKKIIKEAIKAQINEGPLDAVRSGVAGVKGVGSGVAGAFRGIGTNYRLNSINSQFNQFADKMDKHWQIHSKKIEKAASKLSTAKDHSTMELGNQILGTLEDVDSQVRDFQQKLRTATPTFDGSKNAPQMSPREKVRQDRLQQQQDDLGGIASQMGRQQQQIPSEEKFPKFSDWLADNYGFGSAKEVPASFLRNLHQEYQSAKAEFGKQKKQSKASAQPKQSGQVQEPAPEPVQEPAKTQPEPTPEPAQEPIQNPFQQTVRQAASKAAYDLSGLDQPLNGPTPMPNGGVLNQDPEQNYEPPKPQGKFNPNKVGKDAFKQMDLGKMAKAALSPNPPPPQPQEPSVKQAPVQSVDTPIPLVKRKIQNPPVQNSPVPKPKKTLPKKSREDEIISKLGPQEPGKGWSFSQLDKVMTQIPPKKKPSAKRKRGPKKTK